MIILYYYIGYYTMTQLNDIKIEHDLVLVEQVKLHQIKSTSGIIITEVTKHADTLEGKVIAISESSPYSLTLSLGDTIYFTESSVKSKTKLHNKEYLILAEKDILGYHTQ